MPSQQDDANKETKTIIDIVFDLKFTCDLEIGHGN